jgi:hypothetical protein
MSKRSEQDQLDEAAGGKGPSELPITLEKLLKGMPW